MDQNVEKKDTVNVVKESKSKPRKFYIFNNYRAFGLPEGTVRAALAIVVVCTSCYAVIRSLHVPDWFIGITGSIITFYYLKWEKNNKDKKIQDENRDRNESNGQGTVPEEDGK